MKRSAFKMFGKHLLYMALLAIIAPAGHFLHAQETPNFDELKNKFEDGQVFYAQFTHRYEDSFTGETQQNSGEIWIGRDQYKIVGSTQVMVVDGDVSRVYDEDKNRLIISDYIEEEDDFAPSRMLQGVDESYRVLESAGRNGTTEIVLQSDDPFSVFKTVTIMLSPEGTPSEIQARDQAENILTTRFSDGLFMNPKSELFDLDAPDNAEYIDLRYNTQ
ncbi:MAG: outer membrane lipoprotein carrier protein LolA [Bacteroidetes bacterium]|nr:outer membrane lipoprotein carrier protein LolA [Bacteroidota bacterium]